MRHFKTVPGHVGDFQINTYKFGKNRVIRGSEGYQSCHGYIYSSLPLSLSYARFRTELRVDAAMPKFKKFGFDNFFI